LNLFYLIIACLFGIVAVAALHIVFGSGITEKHGNNHPSAKGCDWSSLNKFAYSVDIMKCKGDDLDKDKVLSMNGISDKEHKCIEKRADLGNELYEDEVMKCYDKNH